MNQVNDSLLRRGFALPTVLISSVVLIIVLTTTIQLVVTTSVSLREQLNDRMVNLASEAGAEHAQACLQANNYIAQWNDNSPLRPGSSCSGYTNGTCPSACYTSSSSDMRATYSVGGATTNVAAAVSYQSMGRVERLRASDGTPWRVYQSQQGYVSRLIDQVKISGGGGWKGYGHYGTVVTPNGDLYGFGGNSAGQITDAANPDKIPKPVKMALPSGVKRVKLSMTSGQGGLELCIITDAEDVYCRSEGGFSGKGDQLGWNKLELPSGYKVKSMALDGYGQGNTACFIASNGTNSNAYCVGKGDYGMLGSGNHDAAPISRPARFILPSGRQAEKAWVHDTQACVSTTLNELYCAGKNHGGQLTDGADEQSTPVRYKIPQGTKPIDVDMDYHGQGDTIHVLTSSGIIWSSGWNGYGTVMKGRYDGNTKNDNGNMPIPYSDNDNPVIGGTIFNPASNRCLDNYTSSSNDNNQVVIHDCNPTGAQRWVYDSSTNQIINVISGKCLSRLNNGSGDGESVVIRGCYADDGQQRWRFSGNDIIDMTTGKCLDVKGRATANASPMGIWGCHDGGWEDFTWNNLDRSWKAMIAGDRSFCGLMDGYGSGVWCAGQNESGQLGNYLAPDWADGAPCQSTGPGTQLYRQMVLPAGEFIDIGKTSYEWGQQYKSLMVITKNGRIFGSGRNEFGKLGSGTLGDSSNDYRQCTLQQFSLPAGVKAVDMSTRDEYTTYVVGDNGVVYAAGLNNNGQVGDGTTVNRYSARPLAIPRVGFYF